MNEGRHQNCFHTYRAAAAHLPQGASDTGWPPAHKFFPAVPSVGYFRDNRPLQTIPRTWIHRSGNSLWPENQNGYCVVPHARCHGPCHHSFHLEILGISPAHRPQAWALNRAPWSSILGRHWANHSLPAFLVLVSW